MPAYHPAANSCCSRPTAEKEPVAIRIASSPSDWALQVLRYRGVLEKEAWAQGWQVQWTDSRRDGSQALKEGRVDIVSSGSVPPLTLQAGGLDIVYLAFSVPRDGNSALLVMKEGAIRGSQQLAGKRIASTLGTVSDLFLAHLLLQENLRLQDIEHIDLDGGDAARALREGRIDGWAAIEPWLDGAETAKKVHILARVNDDTLHRNLIWTTASWCERYPRQSEWIGNIVQQNEHWIARNVEQAATLLHQHQPGSISIEHWLHNIRSRPWGISVADRSLLAEQQQQANRLFAAGFIDHPLRLSEDVRAIPWQKLVARF